MADADEAAELTQKMLGMTLITHQTGPQGQKVSKVLIEEALNIDKELYLGITRDYYGHAKGVCDVPELAAIEWAQVPHFHYDFYVYQYATSMVAATSLAKAIRDEQARGKGTKARDRYLDLLRAGGSKYPVDLLRDAGVDMTTSKPFDAAMAEMNAIMDEMEKILAKQGKGKR